MSNKSKELQQVFSAIDKAKRNRFWIIAVAGAYEFAGILCYCLLADFSNRIHLLVLIASLLVYGTIAIGIVALGSHINVCTQRVLKAIEVVSSDEEQDEQ